MIRRGFSTGDFVSFTREAGPRKGSVALAVATLLALAATGAAQAQDSKANATAANATATDTPSDNTPLLEEIVVSGFRRSLEASLDIKRDAIGSVDAIVAEDIAKFPDLNLAESIQRIPGVSIARDAGEGRQVTVRGLGPQFTRVRVNGMEAMSANGGTDAAGGTNRDRSFDFNTFASELFNAITIRKTAAAEIEEGSLGATVDLRAAHPFDYQGFTFVSSIQGSYNDIQEDVDPRAAALISDRFFDDKVGILFSAAYTGRKLLDEGSSTVRWQSAQNADGSPSAGASFGPLDPAYPAADPSLAALNAAYRPRIPRFDVYKHDQDRLGLTSSLQWQPTDATLLTFDALYSKFKATRQEIFLEAPVFSSNGANGINDVNPRDAAVDANGTLTYGLFDDVDIRSEARFDRLETQFTHLTLNLNQKLGEQWTVNGLVGYSEANHQNPIQTTLLFDALNVDGYSFDYRNDNRMPLISYGNAAVTDPNFWRLTQIRLRPQTSFNGFRNAQFDVAFKATDQFTFRAGPQYKRFQFRTTSLQRSNGTTANQEGSVTAQQATAISQYSMLTTIQSLDMPAGSVTTWLSPDVEKAASLFNLYDRSVFPLGPEPALGSNFQIEEKDTGGFVQAEMDSQLWGRRFRGNLGVRFVRTEQTSSGSTFSGGTVIPTAVEHDYNDTLPSLNLSLDLTDDFILRFGAAKVMARPNGSGQTGGIGVLQPGASVGIAGANKTVTAGNPLLDPYRAKAYDLAAEWYFQKGGLISVALFYKDIDSFVQIVRSTGDFSSNPLGLPDSVALATCGTAIPDPATCLAGWQFSLPRNSEGGTLKGVEVNYQQPFTFLPAPFDKFGAVLNYTGVDSNIDYFLNPGTTQTINADLINLSKNAFNATLYYENDRWSARVSAAYRSKYLTTVPGRNFAFPAGVVTDRYVEGTNSTLNIDFSSSLNLTENITLTLEALNLTDEYQDQFIDAVANRDSYYHHQGRQYLLGARFKF
jgi:iron complex outermembrane recepter protein